ncbi:hypothetical protein CYMTET_32427 [Cymbomonas tetramitiformis]|uniref:Uncharacterized protein n=1 Tax=Cymbomonas tetramitiformis TaxID=36881 RepID=A0AAE0FET4_9CHLO|nr:hypothetical protein CYMTET_35038 [Cymbomonas tetramitiformis]KAK3258532.1 hypothetical protein CYMTET_32427 [Cymbomonas tetramitiformis]
MTGETSIGNKSADTMLSSFLAWKYRKPLLFTLAEILVFYNYPFTACFSACITFSIGEASTKFVGAVEPYVEKLIRLANPLVLVALVGIGGAASLLESIFEGFIEAALSFILFPLEIVGYVAAIVLAILARKNLEKYQKKE